MFFLVGDKKHVVGGETMSCCVQLVFWRGAENTLKLGKKHVFWAVREYMFFRRRFACSPVARKTCILSRVL
jgi:hypothetical protein